ncbi:hypothetical protein ACFSTC_11120 [Nonomuraea ferruginea]
MNRARETTASIQPTIRPRAVTRMLGKPSVVVIVVIVVVIVVAARPGRRGPDRLGLRLARRRRR